MDFDFKIGDERDYGRQAFRTKVPGLEVKVEGEGDAYYPVADLSASGFAFEDASGIRKEGEFLVVEFYLKRKLFLGGVEAEVVRIISSKNLIGCTFKELNRRQEARLDKLVLEVQKRIISAQKARKREEESS